MVAVVAVVAVVVFCRWVTGCVGSRGGGGEPGSSVCHAQEATGTETETEAAAEDWTDRQWGQLQYNDIHPERPTVRH